jgi:hypothetical protein
LNGHQQRLRPNCCCRLGFWQERTSRWVLVEESRWCCTGSATSPHRVCLPESRHDRRYQSQGLLEETFPTVHATYRTGDANRSTPTAMSPAYEFFLCCVSLIIGAIFASPSQHLIFVSSRSLFRVFLPFFFFSHISSLAYFPFINYTMCRSKMEES